MKALSVIATLAGILGGAQAATPAFESDPPKVCELCGAWNQPQEPFRVFGNTYYVGVAGLSSILIASGDGLILLDGALSQSAPVIAENIRKLGFRVEDIRLIVNSHTHHDHAGGIAALQRASGATVAASPASALSLKQGEPTGDDPQYALGHEHNAFPRVPAVRVVGDNETLRVGELAITAHFTPGHTPGGTTWTWRSCEAKKCLDIAYADSLTAVSAPGFRFTGDRSTASRVDTFTGSIERVAGLPCDVLLTPHPGSFDMEGKLEKRGQRLQENPFIDPEGCKAYAGAARQQLQRRVESERASSSTEPQKPR